MSVLRKVGTAFLDGYEKAVDKIADSIIDTASNASKNVKSAGNAVKKVANNLNTVTNPIPPKPAYPKGFIGKAQSAKDSFVNNVLVSHNTRQIGPISVSTRGGLIDEVVYHARGARNVAIGAWDFATNGVGEHHIGQLLKRSNNSLLGYKTTKLGTGLAFAGAMVAGTPSAAREFNEARQGQFAGTYQMGTVPGLVPQGHAYANNAGATGDLVLALNNNR